MSYHDLKIRSIANYRDRNLRKISKPVNRQSAKCPFPFDKMKSGDYFQIPLSASNAYNEINVLRTTIHQQARLFGIWTTTKVEPDSTQIGSGKWVMTVVHDGMRT